MDALAERRTRPPARDGRACRTGVAVVALALLASLQVVAPLASLNILWRFTVLSFDAPASQALDELALQKTPFADPLGDVLARGSLAASCPRGSAVPASEGHDRPETWSGVGTRSPPTA
jgi:hypothetical protein